MRRATIEAMRCPYCNGAMTLAKALAGSEGDVTYGLVTCRCFAFPIVEGILLLSLAKGYGGAEEALQPYVPLQAAAVQFLEGGRVAELQRWLRKHLPAATPLLDGTAGTYLEHYAALAARLEPHIAAYLEGHARFEVLGRRASLATAVRRKVGARRASHALTDFYPARFYSPYAQVVALQLGQLPGARRLLSLCCGHGMFENLLRADGRAQEVVSIDAQFLSLLAVRHFVLPQGQFICHDLQFGLPFGDGVFDGVFSSTCLPEVPAQRLLATEAVRVTARSGWTWFDGIWAREAGGPQRIERERFYRFNQNLFGRLDDYVPLLRECAGGRDVAIGISATAAAVRDAVAWTSDPAGIEQLLGARREPQIGALVLDRGAFPGFAAPERPWLSADALAASPAYAVTRDSAGLAFERRPGFEQLPATFAPRAFRGYPATARLSRADAERPAALLDAYCGGSLALLPPRFAGDTRPLRALLGS